MIVGPYLKNGGTQTSTLTESSVAKSMSIRTRTRQKNGESVWHEFKLEPGKHSVRLVVRGEPYAGSPGAEIGVQDLVVFR